MQYEQINKLYFKQNTNIVSVKPQTQTAETKVQALRMRLLATSNMCSKCHHNHVRLLCVLLDWGLQCLNKWLANCVLNAHKIAQFTSFSRSGLAWRMKLFLTRWRCWISVQYYMKTRTHQMSLLIVFSLECNHDKNHKSRPTYFAWIDEGWWWRIFKGIGARCTQKRYSNT